jgi:putative transposase
VPDGSPFFITVCAAKRGGSPLLAPGVAPGLINGVRHYHDERRWYCRLILLMPDHLHAVLAVPHAEEIAHLVGNWKRFATNRHGVQWQRGFFDHRLRSPEEGDLKLAYIRQNPVRGGWVSSAQEWPWQWEPEAAALPD